MTPGHAQRAGFAFAFSVARLPSSRSFAIALDAYPLWVGSGTGKLRLCAGTATPNNNRICLRLLRYSFRFHGFTDPQ